MAKLNQILAVVDGKKKQTEKSIAEVYHKLQKADLLSGIAKSYRPKDEEGDKLPSESKMVQYRCKDALESAAAILTDLFDVIATQEKSNTGACADVVVDGMVILNQVPVTYLLFLEKQLVDINTLIGKLPVLDPGQEWVFSEAQNCWATKAKETVRTKKVPKTHVLYDATEHHPAQVQVFTEDVVDGYWTTITYSGAIPEREKEKLLLRVRKLQQAVKYAREQANSIDAVVVEVGDPVFQYLFGDM